MRAIGWPLAANLWGFVCIFVPVIGILAIVNTAMPLFFRC